MFDHVGLKVANLEASIRFYVATLAPLGHVICSRDEASAGIGPKDSPALWLYASMVEPPHGVHVAFRAPDRAAVDTFYESGLRAGGKDHGAPGLRLDYSPTYYAAFLVDPDGNNVEAVFLG